MKTITEAVPLLLLARSIGLLTVRIRCNFVYVFSRMFSKIKAVLIDLSGTLHVEANEIPGSIEALKR